MSDITGHILAPVVFEIIDLFIQHGTLGWHGLRPA